ncbi:HSP90 family protein [Actinotalea sp. BY-33]|uniref:HSP90 family protein n=1 Tax=Actinotalea soli TaxID=2819234 RepID=A0A939LR73_9CELL|nr:HSP90 family protein [Actinotalea soli]MBO1750634.1 HSP90 family protein [Actinotalea soli]
MHKASGPVEATEDDGSAGPPDPAGDGMFQVDLRGMVDLLSHHLYSGPRVYLRELLQNAVDAVTVRGTSDDRPALRLVPCDVAVDGRLHAMDSGVGLDAHDVRTFLATIGRSSKRDELGLARSDLLGQFGIGLLSCFMVTDDIEVVTRRADGPWVHWVGRANGSYDLTVLADGLPAEDERAAWLADGPGTCVTLTPRRGTAELLDTRAVLELARHHGTYLPHPVVVRTASGEVETSGKTPPWRLTDPEQRRTACRELAEAELGGTPFHVLPIRVPEAGLDGVAVISGQRTTAGRAGRHRVHLKGMLLSDSVPDLVPEWAFFVRCALDAHGLRPTANREALFEDDLLEHTRAAIGDQVRTWLVRMATTQPQRMQRFLDLHHVAVKTMALEDDELLRIVLPLLPFRTNQGTSTLPDLLATTDVVRVTAARDDFRQVASVMAAQGVAVVDGGASIDLELVRRLADVDPGAQVEVITAADVEGHVRLAAEDRHREVAHALADVRVVLDGVGVDVDLRVFAPPSVPALLVDDGAARERREVRAVAAEVDDVWGALLGAFDDGGSERPRLLLNDANPTVRRVLALSDVHVRRVAAESLYGRALLSGSHRLRPVDTALLERSFNALLDRAVGTAGEPETTTTPRSTP